MKGGERVSSKWDAPQVVTDAEIAFGGNIDDLLPPLSYIPKEFSDGWTKWHQLAEDLFFGRPLKGTISERDGVDSSLAARHIRAVLNSYKPGHDHKISGAAFLLSKFFEDIKL